MVRTLCVAALVGLAGCGGDPAGASGAGEVALLTYATVPSPAQIQAASAVAHGEVSVLRQAHAISLRTSTESGALAALPGVIAVTRFADDPDPVVSITVVVANEPTLQDLSFVRGLGADVVTAGQLGAGYMINASRLPLSRVSRLDDRPGVKYVEIHTSGPRVG